MEKTNLSELKEMVKELADIEETDECVFSEQVKKLQEILKTLLCEYQLKIRDTIIEPVVLEAYYYHEGKFEDPSVHAYKYVLGKSKAPTYELAAERQAGHFGELYIHYGEKYNGVDLVLSLGDYYLSFLIKVSVIMGEPKEIKAQCGLAEWICKTCGENKKSDGADGCNKGRSCDKRNRLDFKLVKREQVKEPSNFVLLPRKGVNNPFEDKLAKKRKKRLNWLAVVSVDALKDKRLSDVVLASLAKGYKKQWKCSVIALSELGNVRGARERANEYCGSKVEEKYWEQAKDSLALNEPMN